MTNLNTNQFSQVPIRGELDLQISRSGVIQGQISANQATALKAGDPVKLDSAGTSNIPQFVAAAASDPLAFYIVQDVKKATLVAGDICSVAGAFGPVMFMKAEATIAPGAVVEQNSDGNVQTLASGKARGIALDPGAAAGLLRVIILSPTAQAA